MSDSSAELAVDDPAADDPVVEPSKARRWLRLGLLALLLGGLYFAGRWSGYLDNVDIDAIRTAVESAGAWGMVVFVALFAVGVLMQVPGTLFVGTSILVYGNVLGYFVGLFGAFVAVCASFVMVRLVGGQALAGVKRPIIRKVMVRLDERPVMWLVALRIVFFISPPLNYVLALSTMRFRDYALGSAIGLIIPMGVQTLFFDWIFRLGIW